MWARVKGATENALLRMPVSRPTCFRPGYIQPVHGERSSTKWTRVGYALFAPLYPVWKALFPNYVTTTEELARAMLRVAKHGGGKRILEARDFQKVAGRHPDGLPRRLPPKWALRRRTVAIAVEAARCAPARPDIAAAHESRAAAWAVPT
jgi:hypothetical protein